MPELPRFHGTDEERAALMMALNRNCVCETNELGDLVNPCAGHRELATNQRFSDGLLFDRHICARLLAEEFLLEASFPPRAA